LVALSEKGIAIYEDLKSKLIWGDRIAMDFNQYGSQKACISSPDITQVAPADYQGA
jgi:hypothetical protein